MGMERNRDRETEMHGEIREIDRERPKGERKEVGRVVEEGGGNGELLMGIEFSV